MVDIIIPVYRPDDKLVRLIEKLNQQTIPPAHIFFMQTLVGEEKEDERVRQILEKAESAVVVSVDKMEFDHGGTRNRGAMMSKEPYLLFMTQDAVP